MQTERRRIRSATLRLARRMSERSWWHGVAIDYLAGSIVVYAKSGAPSMEDLSILTDGHWEGIRVEIRPFVTPAVSIPTVGRWARGPTA